MAKSNHTKPRKKGGALKILLVILVLLVLAAGAALLLAKREIDGSGEKEEAVTVEIAQGSGVSTIAKKLQEAGVIRFPQLFRWYVGREGAAAKLQYGEFSLEPGSSYDEIIAALSEYAKAESVRLTFPEESPPSTSHRGWKRLACAPPRSFWKKPIPAISARTNSGSMSRTTRKPPTVL